MAAGGLVGRSHSSRPGSPTAAVLAGGRMLPSSVAGPQSDCRARYPSRNGPDARAPPAGVGSPAEQLGPLDCAASIALDTGGPMWQPDGWGWRARVGVLMQHADVGPESEFRAMAPAGVSIHAARIPYHPLPPHEATDPVAALEPNRAFAEPPGADDAAELL